MPVPPSCVFCKHWTLDFAATYDAAPDARLHTRHYGEFGFCGSGVDGKWVEGIRMDSDQPGCMRTRHDAKCPAFDRIKADE